MIITRSNSFVHFFARVLSVFLFIFFSIVLIWNLSINYNILAVIVLITTMVNLVLLYYNPSVSNTGIIMIFFAYTILCQNGFVIAYLINKNYINFRSITSMAYVYNEYYPMAIIIGNIVLICFVWGTEVHFKIESYLNAVSSNYSSNDGSNETGDAIANTIGISAVLFGTLLLVYYIFSRGLLFRLYSDVLSITAEIPMMQYGVILTSLGMTLLIAGGTKKGIRIGVVIFLMDMILHFSIGNRGEVLYAAVICLAIYSIRFHTIKLMHVLIAVLAIVILIPFVRIFREGRIDFYTFNPINSLLDVLCEEGFQISSFTYIVQYVEQGVGHVWGMTYVTDFADFISRRLGTTSGLMNVEKYVIKSIMPYKGMGFSMIAELYYNFSTIGSMVAYFGFARFFCWLDNRISSRTLSTTRTIFWSMILVELINLTRNDASTLPLYIFFIMAFTSLYIVLNKIIAHK